MKILFFTPSLARTGSEIAIFNLICNADREEMEIAVAVGAEGELVNQLPPGVPHSNYWRVEASVPSLPQRLKRKLVSSPPSNEDPWLARYARDYHDHIWYINTICQPEVLKQARQFGIDCVVHSHELEQMLLNLEAEDARTLIEYPKLLVACSQTSANVLRRLGRTEALEVVHNPVETKKIGGNHQRASAVRRQLQIAEDTFVWAMSGTIDPNKNPVLFIELARDLISSGHRVHFVWIGSGLGRGYQLFVEGMARDLGVAGKISWVGPRSEDYYDYLQAADGFVLTSFKESFSIVTVEAAYLGKPVVTLDCGGVAEIVKEGMGLIVHSWNRADLVAAMEQTMKGEIGFDAALARTEALRFDAPRQTAHWQNILRKYFSRH